MAISVLARLDGQLYDIKVKVGQQVASGDTLYVVESFKSMLTVGAPYAGRVTNIRHRPGDSVAAADVVVELERSTTP